jgi:hypothetical protein
VGPRSFLLHHAGINISVVVTDAYTSKKCTVKLTLSEYEDGRDTLLVRLQATHSALTATSAAVFPSTIFRIPRCLLRPCRLLHALMVLLT